MPVLDINWNTLNALTGSDLKRETFRVLQAASFAIQSTDADDPSLLEVVPRLADLLDRHHEELLSYRPLVSSLARSTGLWNYIETEFADETDALVAEAVTAPELGGVTFHREQIKALDSLLAGRNLILSAPTSFGKSLLIDALLSTERYRRVAIVLPTIALLDEFRRRFRERFSEKFKLVMHQSETAADEPTIFLGTQERLIYREDLGNLDLTVVDEFYKLDPDRRDERSITLNAAVYRLLKKSKQFFFLGPNIDKISAAPGSSWEFEFLATRFSTVAVETLDLQGVSDKHERLIEEIGEDKNWPALVFISSPGRANKLAIELSEKMAVAEETSGFAIWLKHNIGANNFLSLAVYYGFGVHHGRIPRAIAAQMVRLFNQGRLPILLCTSTLIEGVNTAAKTVMIYDKKINRDSYDFFTYSNIKGRAGRLGQHHVGQVMVFNEIPEHTELEVSPTLFSEDDELPDEYIVHIDKPDRSKRSDDRFRYYRDMLGLEGDELKLASSIGLETAISIKEQVIRSLEKSDKLIWANWPRWPEILEVCDVFCSQQKVGPFGAFNTRQLATLIDRLRKATSLKSFLLDQDQSYKGQPENRDNIFKFLRACEYGLPQNFALVELFVRQSSPQADYSLFLGSIGSWFQPEILKELDEEGVPIQISQAFYVDGDTKTNLRNRLHEAIYNPKAALSEFEREWLQQAL
ncbi:DEAD/DEAH box helicase [Phaeobacter gallaeciensis]|uniref:DEAD/DEAH box helicase n=1 Tax=Phaeobacter gallaeciensis TaxID=60890 RepID=UPI00237F426E|nr:DEAD/DEAH box helicase [Phaeobacter gallaeciensis]MDE4140956.1 helicase-related protein [Phaeobacter gallaeciensis]MDE4149401.1 helicase-related protein [Phaeobacter gallaeciensis]MDE4153406.1 helicase-related protein [Phaeobacter gallaeciensis]MDE4228795.1 helicase-related protein [Phaeobacter gallaeciensis]MDE4257870.1 helicase-related protein [Phaeobacter gallaeciensis]